MTGPLIRLERASIGYAGVGVLHDVDLTIHQGDVTAVLGSNGSGKSTLVRGVLGLAELQGGSIRLFGQEASAFDERWRIGYVPQRTVIAGALPSTVREIVTSGRLARLGLGRRLRAADRAAVDAALETVDLAAHASAAVAALSGGQQRRVTIARALAAEPSLLILDEPTAGIDAESQARLAGTLERLSESGTTIVLIAHELGPTAHLISRVVVLRDGSVAFDGAPDQHPRHGGDHDHADELGCEHQHDHGDAPIRPGTGLMGW